MPKPSLRAVFTNWSESELPIPRRFWTALRNNAIKVRTMSDCCGHEGEPGC